MQVLTHKLSFRLPLPIVLLVNGAKLLMDADFNERIRVLKLLDRQSETYIDKSKIILEVTVFKIG